MHENNNQHVMLNRVSVITVSFNDELGLRKTINSVMAQDYANMEFIVIDGDSEDGSEELLIKNKHFIDKVLIEPDQGVYHAMNKGIQLADGDWIIFMNAGDVFASNNVLTKILGKEDTLTDVFFSDWFYFNCEQVVHADIDKLNVRHQSVIYKRALHESYGTYLVGTKVTISDYLFFLSIRNVNWKYCEEPISICDQYGLSANPTHFYQRILSECIFGSRSRISSACILLLYPIYRFLKYKIFVKIKL